MMIVMDEQAQDVGRSEEARQDPTRRDASGDAATSRDDYVSLREAREMFLSHGRPVTDRTLQRSCKKQHFGCKKVATADGEKWFALKSSVLNRIAELDEFDRVREHHDAATRRDAARQVAPKNQGNTSPDNERPVATPEVSPAVEATEPSQATGHDQARPVATSRDATEDVVALYERLLTSKEEQIEALAKDKASLHADKDVLVRQLVTKDRQIDRFFASERDTKSLLGSLQTLFNSIWPGSSKDAKQFAPMRDALDTGLPSGEEPAPDRGRGMTD